MFSSFLLFVVRKQEVLGIPPLRDAMDKQGTSKGTCLTKSAVSSRHRSRFFLSPATPQRERIRTRCSKIFPLSVFAVCSHPVDRPVLRIFCGAAHQTCLRSSTS